MDHPHDPIEWPCYEHLTCNRGPAPSCLDWTEICDGKIDCLDSEADEEHCWKWDVNQCDEEEFRCDNGQCIPKALFRDGSGPGDSLDEADMAASSMYDVDVPFISDHNQPTFE